jgi:hypothetical protein
MTITGFTTNPVYDALERQLAKLAAKWRGTKSAKIIEQYHDVMNTLMELGWDDTLDMDAELPEEHMPKQYIERHPLLENEQIDRTS